MIKLMQAQRYRVTYRDGIARDPQAMGCVKSIVVRQGSENLGIG